MKRFALIGGGARSGKSAFALRCAEAIPGRRAFIATAEAFDDEMRARIAAHVAERGDRFTTFDAPLDLEGALEQARGFDVIVIDCITLWLSNHLLRDADQASILDRVDRLARALATMDTPVFVVTNEVGFGLVPETRLGRMFRDLAGHAHQRLARAADELYLAAMGVIVRLRPGAVAVVAP